MLEQVLLSLRNWFVADKRTGRVRIDGRLVPPAALGLKGRASTSASRA